VSFLPPQASQNAATSALASLGSLAGLAGGSGAGRNVGEQYVALMQSASVSDRLIERFKLMEIYETRFRADARKMLSMRVRISLGKKDGLIGVEVDDANPQRAADIANRYVDELRQITGTLAVTEAQQRRIFFEQQLANSRDRLVQAQQALQSSGFNAGALKSEPKSAADAYAKLKAEATATEVRLQTLRGNLSETAPEVQQQRSILAALRSQLAQAEQSGSAPSGSDYIGKYRDFKYQETLFEMYARQFELARVDESREGTLIQVIDAATPPEKSSKPKHGTLAAIATLVAEGMLLIWVLVRRATRSGSAGNARRPELVG
jgi:capsule polysaccharide export protein KpsE/RkpR